jgi:hypothetical protein
VSHRSTAANAQDAHHNQVDHPAIRDDKEERIAQLLVMEKCKKVVKGRKRGRLKNLPWT